MSRDITIGGARGSRRRSSLAPPPESAVSSKAQGPTEKRGGALRLLVGLRREFENIGQALKTVASRWSQGAYRKSKRLVEPPVVDSRGRLVRAIGMAQTFLKEEQVDELVVLYRRGWTLASLADRFGIHKRTAAAHLVRRSVPIRGKGLSEDDLPEAARLYAGGATLIEVGSRFGVSQQTIRRALAAAGVQIRPSGRRRDVSA